MRGWLLALAICAGGCATTRAHYALKLPELHTQLDNGLRVIVLPDDTTDLVALAVRYEVGANEDPAGKAGLAHLVEHLMFQQRPQDRPDLPPVMVLLRQLTVYVNAYTTWDSTHYDALAAREHLADLVALEASRLVRGCEGIDEATFTREREVVRNEIRQRLGSPEGQIPYLLLADLFPAGHPYAHTPGGNDETITQIKLADVCQFMQDYYVPSRAILVVAGNTTEAEMRGLVAEWFAPLPARAAKARREVAPLTLSAHRVEHELDVQDTIVSVAWKLPARFSADDDAAGFMIGAVAGGVSGEGDEWEFAKGVSADVLGGAHQPVFVVQVRLRSAGDVDKALAAVWRAAKNAHRGLEATSQSLEDLRARLIANKVFAYEALNARTNEFGDYAQFDASGGYFAGELQKIRRMSLGRIKGYVKSALAKSKAVIIVIKPKKGATRGDRRAAARFDGAAPEVHDQLDVDPAEAGYRLKAPRAKALAAARRFTLGNGLRVVLLPSASALPVMTVKLVFDVGTAQEPADRAGLATVAGRLLSDAQLNRSSRGLAVANPMSRVGAQRFVQVETDHTIFTVRGLAIYQGILIKGLERLVKVGLYSQDGIESYAKYFRFALQRAEVRQQLAFQRALDAALYGPDHAYTVTGFPTAKSIGRIGRDVTWDFKDRHYSAKNATLIVAGRFDEKAVEASIRGNFGDWSGGHRDSPVAPTLATHAGPQVVGVEGEELPQLEVRLAYPAPAGVDGQYAARLVLAEMLQLRAAAVREELGASYGVHGRLETNVGPSAYVLGGSIDVARAPEALTALRRAIDTLRAGDGFDATRFDADFVRARRTVLKTLLTASSSSLELATRLEFLAKYHLDEEFSDKLVRQIANLSREQLKALIAAEIAPAQEILVALGPRKTLELVFAKAELTATRWVGDE